MDDDGEREYDRQEVLLALQSLLDFAKLSADEISAQDLADAIDDAKLAARASLKEIQH